jgi:hypothetical protein
MSASLYLLLAGMFVVPFSHASAPLQNPGFESGVDHNWWLFLPNGTTAADCSVSVETMQPHGGLKAADLRASRPVRFALVSKQPLPVVAEQKYRLVAWVRGGPDARIDKPTSPGLYIRLLMRTASGKDAPDGHVYVALNGSTQTTLSNPRALPKLTPPEYWTRIESVFLVPAQAVSTNVQLTCDGLVGDVLWDDVSLEPVSSDTPLSPVMIAQTPTAPALTASDLFAALDLEQPDLAQAKTAVTANDYASAAKAYLAFRRAPGTFHWPVEPINKQPLDATDITAKAELVAQNKFDPSGMVPAAYRAELPYVDYGSKPDWTFNPVPKSDPAYTLEYQFYINRMPFWESLDRAYGLTGDERYAEAWVRQLTSWVKSYPRPLEVRPGDTIVWRTLESGIRMMGSWPDSYARFLHSNAFTPEANLLYLSAVIEHGRRLAEGLGDLNRSGNWVVTEACGLASLACLFPELKEAAAWRDLAFARLNREIHFQVWPDGAQIELSPHYHNVTRHHFAFALWLARINGVSLPADFEVRLRAMYRYSLEMMDATGYTPTFNDGLPVNQLAGLSEAAELWPDDTLFRFGAAPTVTPSNNIQPADSNMLPYAGFAVMRSGWGKDDLAIWFRAGPPGYAHWHEDKLSLQIALGGQPLLTEAGHFNYTGSAMRRYVLTTSAHSTATVDRLDQTRGVAGGNFTAKPAEVRWTATRLFDYAAADYADGYVKTIPADRLYFPIDYEDARMRGITHRRHVIYLRPAAVIVVDCFTGTGKHRYDLFWHLDAQSADYDPETRGAISRREDGKGLVISPFTHASLDVKIVQGRTDPSPLGWVAREHRPIPVVVQSLSAPAPSIIANLLVPWQGTEPATSAQPLDAGPGWWSGQVIVNHETWRIWLRLDETTNTLPASTTSTLPPLKTDDLLIVLKEPTTNSPAQAGAWGDATGARLWQWSDDQGWEQQ